VGRLSLALLRTEAEIWEYHDIHGSPKDELKYDDRAYDQGKEEK
jgi:hypothetical protein